jgi:hypothetical protein
MSLNTSGIRSFKKKINLKIVKPRLTNLIQPADVVLFETLKKRFHPKWNDWFLNAPKEMTSHGKKWP